MFKFQVKANRPRNIVVYLKFFYKIESFQCPCLAKFLGTLRVREREDNCYIISSFPCFIASE